MKRFVVYTYISMNFYYNSLDSFGCCLYMFVSRKRKNPLIISSKYSEKNYFFIVFTSTDESAGLMVDHIIIDEYLC
jgi:hypothetical protein